MNKLRNKALFKEANYVAGAWIEADSGKEIYVINPVDRNILGRVPACGAAAPRAIEAASAAWPAWRSLGAVERLRLFAIGMILFFLCSGVGFAGGVDMYGFASERESQRFLGLTKGLRCLVCQNQSLADSDAVLAKDLRDKIYGMMQEEKTDEEIKAFLVSRYGDFILFSPPVKQSTIVLWGFPLFVLMTAFGGIFLLRRARS